MKIETLPPKASISFLRITVQIAALTSGIFMASDMGPFSSIGSTCLR